MRLGVLLLSCALAWASLTSMGCALGAGEGDGSDSANADPNAAPLSVGAVSGGENDSVREVNAAGVAGVAPGTTLSLGDPDRPPPHPWVGGQGAPKVVTASGNPAPGSPQAAK